MIKALISLFLLPVNLYAAKSIMEGIPASSNSLFVSTQNARLIVSATSYDGGLSNVGLYVSSNVVISDSRFSNKCILYSTGSLNCLNVGGVLNGNATTASALLNNGTNCAASSYPLGVDASGNSESCGTNISGNADTATSATTATSLAANGTNCSAGNYPLGVDASGNAESCTAALSATVISSFTYLTPGTLDKQFYGSCIATVTITSSNGPIAVWFSGFLESTDGTVPIGWSVLVNGAFPSSTGLSTSIGLLTQHPISSNVMNNLSAMRVLPAQGSGAKNICLTFAHPNSAAAITLRWTDPSTGDNIDSTFGAYEIK